MGAVDGSVAWRAAPTLDVSVAVVLGVRLAALPRKLFEEHGWPAWPGAWAACVLPGRALRRLAAGPRANEPVAA